MPAKHLGLAMEGNLTQSVKVVEVKMFDARDQTTGRVVVVAVYDPPGNIGGTYSSNVPPPRDISIC